MNTINVNKVDFYVNGEKSRNRFYHPQFLIDLIGEQISKVEFFTYELNDNFPVDHVLAKEKYSLAYGKGGEMRLIKCTKIDGTVMGMSEFIEATGMKIKSENYIKTGKYIGTIFKPVRYSMTVNSNDVPIRYSNLKGPLYDGFIPCPLHMVRKIYPNIRHGEGFSFRMATENEIVKGHGVAFGHIKEFILYKDNVKSELSFKPGKVHIHIEPVKLSENVMLDIQSMLNLWPLFGIKTYLKWAVSGMSRMINDVKEGRVEEWLDDIENLDFDTEDYQGSGWILQELSRMGTDYRSFPRTRQMAYMAIRKRIMKFLHNKGQAKFNIPIHGAIAGYMRPDFRNIDRVGNMKSSLKKGQIALDKFGNIHFSHENIEEILKIHGGADWDDRMVLIPFYDKKNNKVNCVGYRNPNQIGEYGIYELTEWPESLVISTNNTVDVTAMKPKSIKRVESAQPKYSELSEREIDDYVSELLEETDISIVNKYSLTNLARQLKKMGDGSINIGSSADADMHIAAGMLTEPNRIMKLLKEIEHWDLEIIIDAGQKDGSDVSEEMIKVRKFMRRYVESGIRVAKCLVDRLPKTLRDKAIVHNNHPVDILMNQLKALVAHYDKEMNEWVKLADVDYFQFKGNDSTVAIASDLLRSYGTDMRKMFENAKTEVQRIKKSNTAKYNLIKRLYKYKNEERRAIVKAMFFVKYGSSTYYRDSALWISNLTEYKGEIVTADKKAELIKQRKAVAEDFKKIPGIAPIALKMLQDVGMAYKIEKKTDPYIDRFFEAVTGDKVDVVERFKNVQRIHNPRDMEMRTTKQIYAYGKDVNMDYLRKKKRLTIRKDKVVVGTFEMNLDKKATIGTLQDGKYSILEVTGKPTVKDPTKMVSNNVIIHLAMAQG